MPLIQRGSLLVQILMPVVLLRPASEECGSSADHEYPRQRLAGAAGFERPRKSCGVGGSAFQVYAPARHRESASDSLHCRGVASGRHGDNLSTISSAIGASGTHGRARSLFDSPGWSRRPAQGRPCAPARPALFRLSRQCERPSAVPGANQGRSGGCRRLDHLAPKQPNFRICQHPLSGAFLAALPKPRTRIGVDQVAIDRETENYGNEALHPICHYWLASPT